MSAATSIDAADLASSAESNVAARRGAASSVGASSDDPRGAGHRRRWIALAIVVGCALRLARPEVHSFWIDEGMTLLGARSSDLWTFLRGDSHPPLHFLAVRAWIALFGESDLALRLLPALLSCVSLALFAPLARAWLGERRATWAVALYAASPLCVWLAHEVRVYAFAELATLLVLHAARWHWRRPGLASFAGLAVAQALGAGTHWYGPLAGGVVALQALARWRRGAIGARALASTSGAVALGVLAWIPAYTTLLPAQMSNAWPRIAHTTLRDLVEIPPRLVGVDFAALEEHGLAVVGWTLGALCEIGLAVWIARTVVRRRGTAFDASADHDTNGLDAFLAALVPIGGALALALVARGGFQPRYVVFAMPGAVATIAGGLASLRPRGLAIGASAVLLACAAVTTVLQLSENRREDYRSACAEIAADFRPGDRVLVIACVPNAYELACVEHYWRDRPDLRAALVDRDEYLGRATTLARGTRLHVLWREATICWDPWDRLRRTHELVEAEPARFRIHRYVTHVP